jgi:hypothetical protein
MQLGTHISNIRAHISKVPDIRVIMGLQDVRVGSIVNVYKACRQAATVRLQCSANIVDHSPDTSTVLNDSTARCHTAD